MDWARPGSEYTPDNIHGCSRAHVLLAVANVLGFGIDGKAAGLVTSIARERDDAQKEAQRLRSKLEDAEQERDRAMAMVAELRKALEFAAAAPYQCTPCPTWQEPEYGGRCQACGGSKEEHEGRGQ